MEFLYLSPDEKTKSSQEWTFLSKHRYIYSLRQEKVYEMYQRYNTKHAKGNEVFLLYYIVCGKYAHGAFEIPG